MLAIETLLVTEFLREHSTARIQIGTRNMSYIDNEHAYIVYDIKLPREIMLKTERFDLAWDKLVSV